MATAIIASILKFQVGGVFAFDYSMLVPVGIGSLLAGCWTYKTRDSFYVSKGQRKRMMEDNSFFFISMEYWSYIFETAGVVCLIGGVVETVEIYQ